MSIDPALLNGPYDTVFDVGADRGDFARACLLEWPGCRVESFEPLRELVNLDPGGRWHWHRVALSETNGEAVLWRNDFEPSSSLLPMLETHKQAFPYTRRATTQPVTTVRLGAYASFVRGRALLKIDVQGAELRVLEGGTDDLHRFGAVVLEVSHVPLYQGGATPDEISAALQTAGFTHRACVDVLRHPVTRQILQTDELWEVR